MHRLGLDKINFFTLDKWCKSYSSKSHCIVRSLLDKRKQQYFFYTSSVRYCLNGFFLAVVHCAKSHGKKSYGAVTAWPTFNLLPTIKMPCVSQASNRRPCSVCVRVVVPIIWFASSNQMKRWWFLLAIWLKHSFLWMCVCVCVFSAYISLCRTISVARIQFGNYKVDFNLGIMWKSAFQRPRYVPYLRRCNPLRISEQVHLPCWQTYEQKCAYLLCVSHLPAILLFAAIWRMDEKRFTMTIRSIRLCSHEICQR